MSGARVGRGNGIDEAQRSVLTRRNVLVTAAWTAPVITLAAAAPAFSASGDQMALNSPPASFTTGNYGYGPLSVTVRDVGLNPISGAAVGFTSNQTWVSPRSASAATNASGVATVLLQFNSVPALGSTALLTATYDTNSSAGLMTVSWTVTYQPLTVAERIALGNAPGGAPYRQVRGIIRGNQTGNTAVDTTSPWTGDTNLVIADTAVATNYQDMVPVELTTAGNLRTTWGMQTNPGRQGQTIDVTGDPLAFFLRPGMKDDTSTTIITIMQV
jgi:hypothetical protein